MKISQVKSNIQIIISNLKQLQTYRNNLTQQDCLTSETANIAECKQNFERRFPDLEAESIQKVVAELKHRKKKRKCRSKKIKAKINHQKSVSNVSQAELPIVLNNPEQKPLTNKRKRELRSANKYLAIMKSLESLHQLKGGEDACKLHETLNPIKSIWLSIAQKIQGEEQKLTSIESQWDYALFGGNSEIEEKWGFRNVIERRCIWDSYLVADDDSTGSFVPIGWVCPKENARQEWKHFKQEL